MLPKQAFVIAFLFCLIVPFSLAKYGESCETPGKDKGKCVPLKSCAGAYELLQSVFKYGEDKFKDEISFLQESRCDSADNTLLVCCPTENIQINPAVYNHLKGLNCGNSGISKVSKGQPAGLFDFRWMALLKYDGKEPFACGGSLIDERHVLTAAHCLHNFENLPIAVRLGEYDLRNETDCLKYGRRLKCLDPIQDIAIEKYIIHEDYIYKGLHNDIAILRLERPVNITKSISPICLPISAQIQTEIPEEFLVAGWGMTEFGNLSNVLLWTAIPNRPNSLCEESLGLSLSDDHICAGGRKFRDTCKGDSGGPLFSPNVYADGVARAIQYGVVSIGAAKCGEMSVPAVYMKTSNYIQWITDHMVVGEDGFR